jgi:hypothetical protein
VAGVKIAYDPLLTEAVLLQEIARRREAGDAALFRAYHAAADPLYHRSPEAREVAFRELHQALFLKLGFAGAVEAELTPVPSIGARAQEILVALAAAPHEEGADLSLDSSATNGQPATRVGIRLRAEQFLDRVALQRFVRHELRHIVDLLDPDFGYEGDRRLALGSPIEENLVRGRYRLLWCLSIDARLDAAGDEPLADREARRKEFEVEYRRFPLPAREAIFEHLWRPEARSHRWLLDMATDSRTLLHLTGDIPELDPELIRPGPLPGSPCPLCRFPSYHFVEDQNILDRALVAEIRRDFPDWGVDDGMCERCLEVYALKVGCS